MPDQHLRRAIQRAKAVKGREEAATDRTDYRSLIELATVGVTRTDTGSGRIYYANDAFCRFVGYSHDELSEGKLSFVELTHPDDRAKNIALHKLFMAGQLPHYAVEKRYIRKDGTCVWARTIVSRMRSAEVGTDETFAVILDITHEVSARAGESAPATGDVASGASGTRRARLGLEKVDRYIREHWNQPITVDQLAGIANQPIRTFHKNFKQLRGASPKSFIKRLRLEKARSMLTNAKSGESVSSIAFRCAFANLGHFAKDYRQLFGELPSETIRTSNGE